MNNWHERALELYSQGLTKKEVTNKLVEERGEPLSYHAVRHFLRRWEIKMEKTAGEVIPENKRVMIQNTEPEHYNGKWDGATTIKFGIVSDTHFGSVYTQITHLHDFYDLCAKEGIKDVYHTGDITDGLKMRPGHEYELYEISADGQCEDVSYRLQKMIEAMEADYGYLLPAALVGLFGVIVGVAENVKFIGDEEEPNEEGES